MPTYEFKCNDCGTTTTEIFKFHENHIVECDQCMKVMNKIISAPPAVFRGTGWGKDK